LASDHGVLIGRRANGNCVLCQNKTRHKLGNTGYSFCSAFGKGGPEAIKAYFRCKYHTDPGEEGNAFVMIEGKSWR